MKTTITDRVRVFARQLQGKNGPYTAYSTTMGKKNQDGTWDNSQSMYIEFQNGTPVPQNIGSKGVEIDVKEGWLTFRNYQPTSNGKPIMKPDGTPAMRTAFGIHIKSWVYPQQNRPQQAAPQQTELPASFATVEDDMPF